MPQSSEACTTHHDHNTLQSHCCGVWRPAWRKSISSFQRYISYSPVTSIMSEADVTDHNGLIHLLCINRLARANILDRIFVSSPCYSNLRVVKAVVRSDHKAIVAHQESVPRSAPKTVVRKSFRKRTSAQNTLFLQATTPCHNGC